MKKLASVLFAAGLVMIAAQAIAYAQAKPQWWFVREQVVVPEKISDYYEGVMEEWAQAAKYGLPFADVAAWSSNDFRYYFSIPIEGLDSVDDLQAAWTKFRADLKGKMGDAAFNAMMKKLEGTVEYDHYHVFIWRPDLSYSPQAPRLKPEEGSFLSWQYWYIKDGMVDELEAVAKEMAALFKDKNYSETVQVMEGQLGDDVPVYFAAFRGKDLVDQYAHDVSRVLGHDKTYAALVERLYKTARKLVRVNLNYVPELSYHSKAVK